MTKAFGFLLLLIALAATAMWLMQTSEVAPHLTRAPEILPADTLLLAEFPDVARTRDRLKGTAVGKLLQEPEIEAFLERPREKLPLILAIERALERLDAIQPSEAFLAMTSVKDGKPSLVGGLAFSGDLEKARELFAMARLTVLKEEPELIRKRINHHGAKIDSYISKAGALFETIHDGWYLAADEIEQLTAAVDRLDRRASRQQCLANDPKFLLAKARASTDFDGSLYADTARLEQIARPLLESAGRTLVKSATALGLSDGAILGRLYPKSRAIFATTRIEGPQFRDTIFVLTDRAASGKAAPEPRLQRATLALSESSTVLYYVTRLPRSMKLPLEAQGALAMLPGWAQFEKSIADRKVTRTEFDQAFGPEVGAVVNWPTGAALPSPIAALQIRDPAKAEAFIAALVQPATEGSSPWTKREHQGIALWEFVPSPLTGSSPALALSDEFLVFGLSADSVARAVTQLKTPEERLDHQPRFATAINAVQPPSRNFLYVDLSAAVNRAYGALKPLATMALAMNDGSDSPIDADKLPPVDVLTRHLTPIVYSECSTPDGYQMESVGSLTLNQAVVALAGGAAAVLGPHIQKLMKGGLSTSEPPPSVANGQRPESEPTGNRQTAPPEQKLGNTSPQPERPPDPQEPVPSKAPCDP